MSLLCQELPSNRVRAHLVKVSRTRALLLQDCLLTFRSPRLTVLHCVVVFSTFFDLLIGVCVLVETLDELLSVKLVRVDVQVFIVSRLRLPAHILILVIIMNVLPNLVIILVLVVVSAYNILSTCSRMTFTDRAISKIMMQLLASVPIQLASYQFCTSLRPVRCFLKPHVDHRLLLLQNTCGGFRPLLGSNDALLLETNDLIILLAEEVSEGGNLCKH